MATSSRVPKLASTSSVATATLSLQVALDRIRAGRNLAALRESKRLTQEALAEQAGVSKRTIQRAENGHNLPRWNNLDQLSTVLGDEVYDIFREADVEPEVTVTPDVMTSMNGGPQMQKLEQRIAAMERTLTQVADQLRQLNATVAAQTTGTVATGETRRAKPSPPKRRRKPS